MLEVAVQPELRFRGVSGKSIHPIIERLGVASGTFYAPESLF